MADNKLHVDTKSQPGACHRCQQKLNAGTPIPPFDKHTKREDENCSNCSHAQQQTGRSWPCRRNAGKLDPNSKKNFPGPQRQAISQQRTFGHPFGNQHFQPQGLPYGMPQHPGHSPYVPAYAQPPSRPPQQQPTDSVEGLRTQMQLERRIAELERQNLEAAHKAERTQAEMQRKIDELERKLHKKRGRDSSRSPGVDSRSRPDKRLRRRSPAPDAEQPRPAKETSEHSSFEKQESVHDSRRPRHDDTTEHGTLKSQPADYLAVSMSSAALNRHRGFTAGLAPTESPFGSARHVSAEPTTVQGTQTIAVVPIAEASALPRRPRQQRNSYQQRTLREVSKRSWLVSSSHSQVQEAISISSR